MLEALSKDNLSSVIELVLFTMKLVGSFINYTTAFKYTPPWAWTNLLYLFAILPHGKIVYTVPNLS